MPMVETALISFATSIVAGLIAAWSTHVLAERKSRNDELAKMRLDAYCDFIKITSSLVSARRLGLTQNDHPLLASLNDAKARICICADSSVVAQLENFWLQGGTLELEQEILAFTHLCSAMRASLGRDRPPFEIHLSNVLFKLEPSTYSFRMERANHQPG